MLLTSSTGLHGVTAVTVQIQRRSDSDRKRERERGSMRGVSVGGKRRRYGEEEDDDDDAGDGFSGDEAEEERGVIVENEEEEEEDEEEEEEGEPRRRRKTARRHRRGRPGQADEEDEDDEGEDLMETMAEDYREYAELNRYTVEGLDETEYGLIGAEERRAAEEEIDARRRQRNKLITELVRDFGAEEDEEDRMRRRQRFARAAAAGGLEGEEGADGEEVEDDEMNLEAFDVPLREWIAQDRTRREIKRRFRNFLETYTLSTTAADMPGNLGRPGRPLYVQRIREMCAANLASLEVSFVHVSETAPILAIWLADAPKDILAVFDEVLTEVVLREFPYYADIVDETKVRITDLPISDRIRDLRQTHLNALIRVSGVVTRRTGVFPQMKYVKFSCGACGFVFGPFPTNGAEVRPAMCPNCTRGSALRVNQEQTVFGNYQKITLQESPSTVPPGRVPRYKDVILLGDLIDKARPGEEVEITGAFVMAQQASQHQDKTGFPVFHTTIEANSVKKSEDSVASTTLTDDDKLLIQQLAADPHIVERVIHSIAPSIYGHKHVKTAIALALFGGSGISGDHRVRGDINVLLLGDPGTAKSQVLKYVSKISPRAVYTTGKGASAVGLTAAVHRDPLTKEWTLEGGALVLADRGVCLIDEFDKMNDADRTSIHEAMEQQSISVSKAGIVTSLQARCSVIAAANPIGGRYDPSYTLAENVELTDPILQRFDILCVLQDVVDPIADEHLARFVVRSHRRSRPTHIKEDEEEEEEEVEEDQEQEQEQDLEGEHRAGPSGGLVGADGTDSTVGDGGEGLDADEAAEVAAAEAQLNRELQAYQVRRDNTDAPSDTSSQSGASEHKESGSHPRLADDEEADNDGPTMEGAAMGDRDPLTATTLSGTDAAAADAGGDATGDVAGGLGGADGGKAFDGPDARAASRAHSKRPWEHVPPLPDMEETSLEPIPQDLLRKYIMYARTTVRPKIGEFDRVKVEKVYADLRKQSQASGGVPIAVRHIESVIRMSQAYARMHLRMHVRDEDVNRALKVVVESFIQAQKVSVRRSLERNFQQFLNTGEEANQLLMHVLQRLVKEALTYQQFRFNRVPDKVEVYTEDLQQRAKQVGVESLHRFFESEIFQRNGFQLDIKRGVVVKQF